MRLLVDAGLVIDRREGKNTYYSLNQEALVILQETLKMIFTSNPECICHKKVNKQRINV